MRIAVLSDIHGNLVGLDACLADLHAQGGADAIGAQAIRGNTERYLGAPESETFEAMEQAQLEWTRRDIGEKYLRWLAELPFALRIGDDENQLLVVHANPTNDHEHLWPDADDETLERLIGNEPANTIAFGHLHLPYVRVWRGKTLVNVASAGLPKDGDARVGYTIFTERAGGWQVKQRRVDFDVKRVATQLGSCGIPGSEELVATLRRHRYKRLKGYVP
jgi:predicted phosphodiesterase